jgi:hypothetical protein
MIPGPSPRLKPVTTLETPLIAIKELRGGEPVGYGACWAGGAVAVGVRFDHRHDPAAASAAARLGKVTTEGGGVDHHRGRTHDEPSGARSRAQAARA